MSSSILVGCWGLQVGLSSDKEGRHIIGNAPSHSETFGSELCWMSWARQGPRTDRPSADGLPTDARNPNRTSVCTEQTCVPPRD